MTPTNDDLDRRIDVLEAHLSDLKADVAAHQVLQPLLLAFIAAIEPNWRERLNKIRAEARVAVANLEIGTDPALARANEQFRMTIAGKVDDLLSVALDGLATWEAARKSAD